MGDKVWKAAERAIAKWFPGAKRRGADFGDVRGGNSDLILEGWSIEIKHGKRVTFGLMKGAVEQAERNREKPDDIPVAVIHQEGTQYKDSLVVMRLEEFAKYFVNQPNEAQEVLNGTE